MKPCALCKQPFKPLREGHLYCGSYQDPQSCSVRARGMRRYKKKDRATKAFENRYGRPPKEKELEQFKTWLKKEGRLNKGWKRGPGCKRGKKKGMT